MPTTTEFSLAALVKRVLDSSEQNSPRDLAHEVLSQIDPADFEAALQETLPAFIYSHIGQRRGTAITLLGGSGDTKRKVGKPKGRRWQEAGYSKYLNERDLGADGKMKRIGEMTQEDLRSAAQRRDKLASENSAVARKYRKAERLLLDHDVNTVAELPPEVLAKLFL